MKKIDRDGDTWISKVYCFGDWVDDSVTNMMEDTERTILWGGHRGEIGREIYVYFSFREFEICVKSTCTRTAICPIQ